VALLLHSSAITAGRLPPSRRDFSSFSGRQQKVERETAPAASTPGGRTVLLVEDEPAVRRLARIVLERAGFTIIEASNPGEAETIAATAICIDLLLTDILMPGGTGPDLYRRLASQRPEMRVLFMSGYADLELFDQNALGRDDAFVAKPFSTTALLAKVREVLDR
jgi:DNA-binding NtrC family response regulator